MELNGYSQYVYVANGRDGAESCYFDSESLEGILKQYAPLFADTAIQSLYLSLKLHFRLMKGDKRDDKDDHYEYDFEDDDWRFGFLILDRHGAAWLSFYQKHDDGELMEVRLK